MPKNKIFRISVFILFFIAFAFVAVHLSFTFYYNKKIKNDLEQEVLKQSNGEYELKIESVRTNLFNQSVFINNFLLSPLKNPKAAAPKYFASANALNLVDFDLKQFLFSNNLICSKLELVNPTAHIYRSKIRKVEVDSSKTFSVYQLLQKHIHSLTIRKISIQNADFKVFDSLLDTMPSLSSRNNELEIINFEVNAANEKAGKLFSAYNVGVVINKVVFVTKDSLYSMSVHKISGSISGSNLVLDSIEVAPNYSKKQFSGVAGNQTDRMRFTANKAQFKNINFQLFLESDNLIAEKINIENLHVSAYRDKNHYRHEVRIKSVQQLLKLTPFELTIDTIDISDAKIVYEEVAPGEKAAGKIFMNNLNATITGVTNDTSKYQKKEDLIVRATCMLMGKGFLKATYSFPLQTSAMVFNCSGKLTGLPLSALNTILEPNANVSVKNGIVDALSFSFRANDKEANGELTFLYHDLKIEILNKQTKKSGAIEDIVSFLAHRIIIKEANPLRNQPVRTSEIYYVRNPNRFIFNYSLKSLLSGIKPAIGMPK